VPHPFGIVVSIGNDSIGAISLETLPNLSRGDKEMFYAIAAFLGNRRACRCFPATMLRFRNN
jgi:hypothetical protein